MLLPNQQPLTLFRRSYRMGLVLLSTALASVSCSKENTGQSEETAGRLEISVRPTTVQMTKASDTAFEDGDEFGLTVVQWLDSEPCDLSLIRYEDNVMFTVEEGSEPYAWPTAYYPDRSTPCSFYAYYPYNETGFRRGTNILPVQVATNQGYGISGSDYMVAVKDTVYPTEESVPLVFDHILAKIVLNLIAGDGCTTADLLTSDLTLKSFSTEAEYDIVEQTFSAISSRADIIPSTNWAESSDRITGSCAIVIPQKFRAGESMLYCTINNKILAYKPSSDILFESGRQYNFDITVTVTDLGPSIAVSSEITDWQEGDKIIGDAVQDTPVKGTVEDIDGNVYDYVEIGGLYWTASNMRTTKYTDGRDIPYHSVGTDDWMALTTPAYCYFENLPENKETLGLLYNYYSVLDGNICPEGWRLPTKDELSMLIDEGNYDFDPTALMSTAWDDGVSKGTNETGFTALPSGMAMDDSYWMSDCYLWSSSINEQGTDGMMYGYLYLSSYPWTDWHMASVGMGIRCVKETIE